MSFYKIRMILLLCDIVYIQLVYIVYIQLDTIVYTSGCISIRRTKWTKPNPTPPSKTELMTKNNVHYIYSAESVTRVLFPSTRATIVSCL